MRKYTKKSSKINYIAEISKENIEKSCEIIILKNV